MTRKAIFIGYRRDDTADVAGRIYDALATRFGRDLVFKDVDNLRPGEDFGEHIKSILPSCQAALVLIGPNWIDAKSASGERLLDDPNDWVRVEIELAIHAPNLDVVPVLVNGARMPCADELPESLRPLLRRHAATVRRDPDFHDDVTRLVTALRASVTARMLEIAKLGGDRQVTAPSKEIGRYAPIIIAAAVLFALGGLVASRLLPTEPATHQPPINEATAPSNSPANRESIEPATSPLTQASVQSLQASDPCDLATEQWSSLRSSDDEARIETFVQSTSASCAARALAQTRLEDLRETRLPATTGEANDAQVADRRAISVSPAQRPDPQSLLGRWRVVGTNCAAAYPELNIQAASDARVEARQSMAGSFSRMISGTYTYDVLEVGHDGITYRRPDLYDRSRALQTMTWVFANNSIIVVTNPEGRNAVACTYVR